jgi:hypothetical protein
LVINKKGSPKKTKKNVLVGDGGPNLTGVRRGTATSFPLTIMAD